MGSCAQCSTDELPYWSAAGPAQPTHRNARTMRSMGECDQAAVLRVIHDTHGKALQRYVLGLTRGDMPFAEDVVQESLLRLWRRPEILQQPSDAVRAWLFTVARNQVID